MKNASENRQVVGSGSHFRMGIGKLLLSAVLCLLLPVGAGRSGLPAALGDNGGRPVIVISINGTINPATDDYLKSALRRAAERNAGLLVIKLDTPGGLLPSMQSMVQALLQSPVPTAVYVSPQGGGAMSAGVFITLAANFAVMAPGTTIGAAHPVLGTGQDLPGDSREKIENFAVSLITAIAEQRGRNVKWAEAAVRESIAVTDREALAEKVIDFTAGDLERLLAELQGRTVVLSGTPVTLDGLTDAPREIMNMSVKQRVVNVLADPNIAVLLGLGAILGLALELYHPGAILPGIMGLICLILSLIAGQVLPINEGGLALLGLGVVFFVAELFVPSFGVLGIAGLVCLVLGSIYFIDSEKVWSAEGFAINRFVIGSVAATVGALIVGLGFIVMKSTRRQVQTGREGLVGKEATVVVEFLAGGAESGTAEGKVRVVGEIWRAKLDHASGELPQVGDRLIVAGLEDRMTLRMKR